MEAKDHTERDLSKNNICRLEWIAWAMDAARRHKDSEHVAASGHDDPDFSGEDGE
jgi:hypothetical protein